MRKAKQDPEALLADASAECYADPLKWVLMMFDWGRGDLAGFDGPDIWQRDLLNQIKEGILTRRFDGVTPVDPFRSAVASGHG